MNHKLSIEDTRENKWISTKDKLPKNHDDVLFIAEVKGCLKSVCGGRFNDNKWHIYGEIKGDLIKLDSDAISYWMKIPEIPLSE